MIENVPLSSTVYTPDPLALGMVRALGDSPGASWLDPCAGLGAFGRALRTIGVPPARITAFDLQSVITEADSHARISRGVDFVEWSEHTQQRYDRIVLNPPYVALGRIQGSPRHAALRTTLPDGTSLPLKANYWAAFLLASLRTLASGGGLCAVLPASWDFARYAAPLRSSLPRLFASFRVFRSREPLFPEVQEGAVVLVAHGYCATRGRSVRTETATSVGLVAALELAVAPDAGSVVLSTSVFRSVEPALRTSTVKFADVLVLRLGGVTGDAPYFLLSESERVAYRLPMSCLRPAVTRARHLRSALIDMRAWQALRAADERVWLFSPSETASLDPRVQAYLRLAPEDGGCNRDRWKVIKRDPWYRTVLPRRVDGFISGMSRVGPHLVLRSMPRLTATNTLYVVRFVGTRTPDERAAIGLSLLTSEVRATLQRRGRVYADGLLKFEPSDLASVELPVAPRVAGARSVFRRATECFCRGEGDAASRLADSFFARGQDAEPPRGEIQMDSDSIRARPVQRLPRAVRRS